ncbi:MAG: T9SS type A sorting domain-containing protein [Bacteroidetes bacterium]|nr:T9SS type A sorting domain-containing protein [Bacteroidota bacterium]
MNRIATILALAGLVPAAASAQTIFERSVKELFAVPAANLQQAASLAAAGTLTNPQYEALTRSAYTDRVAPVDTLVRFTAVLLSDPYNSGLASSTSGRPNRVHVFVRDVAAATDPNGMRGYVAQLVDGAYDSDGLLNVGPGAVVTITGSIAYFSGTPQISPISLTVVSPDYSASGLPASIVEPIALSIEDLNTPNGVDANGAKQATLNYANFNPNANEYVRLQSATVAFTASFASGTRYNVVFANPAGEAFIALNDISLRYRSDRPSTYGTGFNVRTSNFVPPAVGSTVRVQGFITPTTNDFVNYFTPNPNVSIVPMEDTDLVLDANAAPSVANLTRPSGLVTGTTAVTVTADVLTGSARSLSSVVLRYTTEGGTEQSVPMSLVSGTQWTATIPTTALQDGKFVTYYVFATDDAAGTGQSTSQNFRVLANGVTSIENIQRTASGSTGDSPLAGVTLSGAGQIQLNAVVQSNYSTNQFAVIIQDDAALNPWSGIQLFTGTTTDYDALKALVPGDRISITAAKVFESNGVTMLDLVTFSKTGTGSSYTDKVMLTTDLSQSATAEQHESMRVRLNSVTVTNANPDAPSNFGEYAVRSVGGTGSVRVDDFSGAIADYTATNPQPAVGSSIDYIAGIWTYSFNNFKLEPEITGDIGTISATEEDVRATGFGVLGAYPTPARGTTAVRFLTTGTETARLAVYDVLGRRVVELAASAITGEQSVTLDASSLAPGVYVLHLSQGSRTDAKTFVVAR